MRRGETSLTIRHPWVVAFAFGLLHGFGFASGLTTDSFADGSTITASQSGNVLTLTTTTGTASAADYQSALWQLEQAIGRPLR